LNRKVQLAYGSAILTLLVGTSLKEKRLCPRLIT
jgi:hypothetical protein